MHYLFTISVLCILSFLSLLSIYYKNHFLVQIVLLESCLMFVCLVSLSYVWECWFILPILGLGAAECSVGLALLVNAARGNSTSCSYSI